MSYQAPVKTTRSLIPAWRLRPLVIARLTGRVTLHDLAARARVSERGLGLLVSGDRRFVQFDIADRLLCALDAVELWHAPPPEGLADLYPSEIERG
jgi:hypothetical protein